jgi:hypothetical protein
VARPLAIVGPGLVVLVAATATVLSPAALANGRFPKTTSVAFQPGHPARIVVGTTFGTLVSEDGASFRWTCEANVGYGGTYDPVYAIGADGTIYATSFSGLSLSRDGGCSWSYAPALAGSWTPDVRVASDDAVWTVTAAGGRTNDVYVSRDGGVTFTATGPIRPGAFWRSIRVAPGDPRRVYLAGLHSTPSDGGGVAPAPLLYRSDDAGASWIELPTPATNQVLLGVLEVSPTDEDLVFARIDDTPDDTLLVSTDAGATWTVSLTFRDNITAFAARADGVTYILGTVSSGVRLTHDRGVTWTPPAQQPQMGCVGERSDDQLFACGANWNPDFFALGRSTDGDTWTGVLRFKSIAGPLACAAGSPQVTQCEPLWPSLAGQFGIDVPDAGPGADGGAMTPNGKGKCGCGVTLAPVALVLLGRRRRVRRSRP